MARVSTLSRYEELIAEYERLDCKLTDLEFMYPSLSEVSKNKLKYSIQKRLRVLLPEIRKKENEV